MYCNRKAKLYCNMVVLEGLEWQGLHCNTLVCIAGWEACLAKCIAIHWTVLRLEMLQEAGCIAIQLGVL